MAKKTKRKPNHQTNQPARKHCLFRADELELIKEAMAKAKAKISFSYFVRSTVVREAEVHLTLHFGRRDYDSPSMPFPIHIIRCPNVRLLTAR